MADVQANNLLQLQSDDFSILEALDGLMKHFIDVAEADLVAVVKRHPFSVVAYEQQFPIVVFAEHYLSEIATSDEQLIVKQLDAVTVLYLPLGGDHGLAVVKESAEPAWVDKTRKFLTDKQTYLSQLFGALVRPLGGDERRLGDGDVGRATDAQKRQLRRLADAFAQTLLKRPDSRLKDKWHSEGVHNFERAAFKFIDAGLPIRFVLPAFPFKSVNTTLKVLSNRPDMAEKVALENLDSFLIKVREIYDKGAKMIIFSDSRVYCDIFDVSYDEARVFRDAIRTIHRSRDIVWASFDTFLGDLSDEQKRDAFVELFGVPQIDVEARLRTDKDFAEVRADSWTAASSRSQVYNGFRRFMTDELTFADDWGYNRAEDEKAARALRMIARNDAYSRWTRALFGRAVRLSIHPAENATKFSVNLVGRTDWATPWHNCAVRTKLGQWTLMRREDAELRHCKLCVSDGGLQYYQA